MAIVVTSLGSATDAAAVSSLSFTVTANVAVGEHIIVCSGLFATRTHTPSDSGTNTYTVHMAAGGTGIGSTRATSGLTSGVSTITVGFGGTDTGHTVAAFKVSGLIASGAAIDKAPALATGTTAAWAGTTSGTLSQSDELVVGACSCDTATTATNTPGAGYTEVHDITNGGAFQLTTIYKIVSATTAEAPGGTWTSTGQTWSAATATFKGDGSGGGGSTIVSAVQTFGPSYAAHRAASI